MGSGSSLTSIATGGDLRVAHCANTAFSSATLTTLDTAGDAGFYTSVAMRADGLGLISYYEFPPNLDVRAAHCANMACTPFYRSSR